ncbi:GntR family transcriptional regulator [Parvularcula lutaonensis]|uniref:GntR family transcriptional regulator n=1 Tax=Parvularcula lutaonensis TaxID=491923 RepID=A0ABV7M746_9PROT|nr:GntR family transcriptional regulator [Parvularcula lutaonensis]GGY56316.1 GntR family transcriptional regulator [Parvularcula lutaonensis]
MIIERSNIRDDITAAVREMILGGRIPDGDRVNEVALSSDLGVSRTPLRESLLQLEAEGLLASKPRKGFFVPPLTGSEFSQLYAVRPILDTEALRLGGLLRDRTLGELSMMNARLKGTTDPAEAVQLDEAWHRLLLSQCPNRVLLGLIEQMMVRTRRYELALFREVRQTYRAGDEHDQILDALRGGDLEAAADALRRNLSSGEGPILAWLASRGQQERGSNR